MSGSRVAAFDHAGLLHEGGGLSSKKLAGLKACASILPFAPTMWKTQPVLLTSQSKSAHWPRLAEASGRFELDLALWRGLLN